MLQNNIDFAHHFLKKVEKHLKKYLSEKSEEEVEEYFTRLFFHLEKITNKNPFIIYQEASLYFQIANLIQKERFLLLALKKFEEIHPLEREANVLFLHLWGRLLFSLAQISHGFSGKESLDNESKTMLLFKAIDKLTRALNLSEESSHFELFWDLAKCWTLAGELSLEINDLKKAQHFFGQASSYAHAVPHFWIDYGGCLYHLSILSGQGEILAQSVEYFKKAIVDLHTVKEESTIYRLSWKNYIKAIKKQIERQECSIEIADPLFYEAISAIPHDYDLWLHWSEIYIRQGWFKKDPALIEKGVEKLISVKIEKVNPLVFTSLLVQGMISLGLFLDDLRIIKEGEKRLNAVLDFAPHHPDILYTVGFKCLAYGLYFSEKTFFDEAIRVFKKCTTLDNRFFFGWHGLFEGYVSRALFSDGKRYFKEAISVNKQLLKRCPSSCILHYEAGLTLMQWGKENEILLLMAKERFKEAVSLQEKPDVKHVYYYAKALDVLGEVTGQISYFEEGIQLLSSYRKAPILVQGLAYLYAHLAERTHDIESLLSADHLFGTIASKIEEDEEFFLAWGCVLLRLSTFEKVQNREEVRKKAEEKLIEAVKLGSKMANYYLACLYCLSGYYNVSIEYLRRAKRDNVLPTYEEMEKNEWLKDVKFLLASL